MRIGAVRDRKFRCSVRNGSPHRNQKPCLPFVIPPSRKPAPDPMLLEGALIVSQSASSEQRRLVILVAQGVSIQQVNYAFFGAAGQQVIVLPGEPYGAGRPQVQITMI